MVMQGLLKAKEKNIDLSFDQACALNFLLSFPEGADVNAKGDGGKTPLDKAIKSEHTEIADLLRKLKAEGR